MFELILEVFGEVILLAIAEAIGHLISELGLRVRGDVSEKPANPVILVLGYTLFGSLLGALSVVALPKLLIASHVGRIVNLVLSPIVVGLGMAAFGAWRARRGRRVLRIDRLAFGGAFALGFALVRFLLAS
ncbi:MAG: hypothetical protein KDB80_17385 [Planctomycetes bacterium]|nr:hypothetical protein [Planctomycetota bacterium]